MHVRTKTILRVHMGFYFVSTRDTKYQLNEELLHLYYQKNESLLVFVIITLQAYKRKSSTLT